MNCKILIFFVSVFCSCDCILQCLNENGDPVDWFVLYKLPAIKFHPNNKIAKGIAYLYITSETVKQGWELAKYPITDFRSIPGRTISLRYNTENNNVFMKAEKSERLKTDKFALISKVWETIFENSQACYKPGANITVDEQLFTTKARCPFTQYMLNKPDKFGIKFWLASDVGSQYLLNGFHYLNKDEASGSNIILSEFDIFWLFYNDQLSMPNVTLKDGHTKGIVMGDEEGGFWIVHSVPKFPGNNSTSYIYPKTGTKYGQSFLCISMMKENLNEVGRLLITNWANTFDSFFTPGLKMTYPDLVKASDNERTDIKMMKKVLLSKKQVPFTSFAKSDKFGQDLYSDWVAEDLLSGLFVESWLHADVLPSICNETYEVHNVEQISVDNFSCSFGNLNDHSKYAVASKKENPWVCIGDINRASTQFIRGGGTVCIQNGDLWAAYRTILSAIEPCPKI